MQIIKQVWEKFRRVAELTLEVLEKKIDFLSFQEQLWKELGGLRRKIVKEVLEAGYDYLREHREEQGHLKPLPAVSGMPFIIEERRATRTNLIVVKSNQ